MLSRLSIRAKITAAVAFLLVAMAGLGLLAIVKMRSINANTVEIVLRSVLCGFMLRPSLVAVQRRC